jgi:hypothetical protein
MGKRWGTLMNNSNREMISTMRLSFPLQIEIGNGIEIGLFLSSAANRQE